MIAREANRKFRQNNPEKKREANREYQQNNPEKKAAISANRRARLRNAPGKFTAADIQQIKALQKNKCACCKKKLGKDMHRDHIISLAKGGTNHARNIQLLCKTCNISKNAKCPIAFMQERGFLL